MLKLYVSDKDDVKFISDIIGLLDQNIIFKEFYHIDKLSSTQDYACELIKIKESIPPSVVICKSQTRGRGRKGNYWSSNEGGIWMSLILETDLDIETLFIFVMICAICICDTIETESNLKTELKWPNDVFINGNKIAGFLIDVETLNNRHCIIIGIGINTNNDLETAIIEIQNNDSLCYNITTLKKELNELEISNEIYISKLLNNLNVFLLNIISHSIDYNYIFNLYKKKIMESKNSLIYSFRKDDGKEFHGEIVDLSYDGSLLVKDMQQNKILKISSVYSVNLKQNK